MMFAKFLVNVRKTLPVARLLLLAACVGTVLFTSGCTSLTNRSGNSDSAGWFTPQPPDPPETVEDFMKLKRMDP